MISGRIVLRQHSDFESLSRGKTPPGKGRMVVLFFAQGKNPLPGFHADLIAVAHIECPGNRRLGQPQLLRYFGYGWHIPSAKMPDVTCFIFQNIASFDRFVNR